MATRRPGSVKEFLGRGPVIDSHEGETQASAHPVLRGYSHPALESAISRYRQGSASAAYGTRPTSRPVRVRDLFRSYVPRRRDYAQQ